MTGTGAYCPRHHVPQRPGRPQADDRALQDSPARRRLVGIFYISSSSSGNVVVPCLSMSSDPCSRDGRAVMILLISAGAMEVLEDSRILKTGALLCHQQANQDSST